ncbi:phosphatase PAP2 family protein [Streptomyces sp. NPDC050560]|uniref:phosphatase PAP2 family protein n=1 Tax=Streptomyces sp. NPDC050560 TaxID=3365630 RepID=UPI0037A91AFD
MAAALFSLAVWQVVAGGAVRSADERLGGAVRGSSAPLPRDVAGFFADLGNAVVAVPLLVAILMCAAWWGRGSRRGWAAPLAAALAMAAVPAVVVPLKSAVGRAGPPGMDGVGYFPSGHAATAGVAYGAAAVLILPRLARAFARLAVATGAVALNVVIGLCLVRRGYHWPLDVLGSWCLTALLLWPVAAVTALYGRRRA